MANINIVHTETHDEAKPAGTRARSLGDDDIREFKRAIRERLAQDHQFYSDETGNTNVGTHKKITLSETQAADPTTYDDTGYLYIKTVSGQKELFWKDSAGNVKQLTSAGKINIAAGIGANIDIGGYELRAQTLQADVAIGTAPLIVASTTKVTNLNADQVDGKDLPLGAVDISGVLGAWVDKSASYAAQQAATDGFVLGYVNTGGQAGSVKCYTDSAADPTTIRQYIDPAAVGGSLYWSFCFPVKKNDYWKIVFTGLSTISVYWIPLGS